MDVSEKHLSVSVFSRVESESLAEFTARSGQ
jgi:hypothetical protein